MTATPAFKPPGRNPGLPNGFVQFDTLAHRVLVALHELGDLRCTDLVDELVDVDQRHVGMALTRLARWGFIFRRRRVTARTAFERTQALWTLQACKEIQFRRMSCAERCRRYHARRRVQVSTVFAFRGRLDVTGGHA